MEGPDIFGGVFQNADEFRLHQGESLIDLRFCHGKRIQLCLVEPEGIFFQCRISAAADLCDDLRDGPFHMGLGDLAGKDLLPGELFII